MNEEKKISDLIPLFFQKNEKLHQRYEQKKIEELWEKTVGKVVYDRTTRVVLSPKKLLIVNISSPPLRQQLQMDKSIILTKLQNQLAPNTLVDLLIS